MEMECVPSPSACNRLHFVVSFSFVYIVIMCCMWQNFGYPLNQLCCHDLGVAIVRMYKLDHQTKVSNRSDFS